MQKLDQSIAGSIGCNRRLAGLEREPLRRLSQLGVDAARHAEDDCDREEYFQQQLGSARNYSEHLQHHNHEDETGWERHGY